MTLPKTHLTKNVVVPARLGFLYNLIHPNDHGLMNYQLFSLECTAEPSSFSVTGLLTDASIQETTSDEVTLFVANQHHQKKVCLRKGKHLVDCTALKWRIQDERLQ